MFIIINLKPLNGSQHHFLGLDLTAFNSKRESLQLFAMHAVNISWLFSFLSDTPFCEGKKQALVTSIYKVKSCFLTNPMVWEINYSKKIPSLLLIKCRKMLILPFPNSREVSDLIAGIREHNFPGNSRSSGIGNSQD